MTHHFSDPYVRTLHATISTSDRGVDIKELRDLHPPEEDDPPGRLRDALNELRVRGAIEIRSGRYCPAAAPVAGKPRAHLVDLTDNPLTLPAPGAASRSITSKKENSMSQPQLGNRARIRQCMADGVARSADDLAQATGLTRKQCIDTCIQLTTAGEFAVDKKGIGGAASTYVMRAQAVAPKKRGRPAGKKVATPALTPRTAGAPRKLRKTAKAVKASKASKPSPTNSIVPVGPIHRDRPAEQPCPLVAGMHLDGSVSVIDIATGRATHLPPAVVRQIRSLGDNIQAV